jgi:GT2 family glycosyltransferase
MNLIEKRAKGAVISAANDVKVVVIVLTHNQRAKTLACLSSLATVQGPPFHILLWDNGSQDGTVEAVREKFPEILVHRHPHNLGVASGRNAAAELALKMFNPSYLMFLDNDMIVTPGYLEALLKPLEENPKLGQVQAKLRFLKDKERLNDGGGCKIRFWLGETTPVGFGEIDRGQYEQPTDCIACGGAMLTRADVFRELGGFDSKFDPFGPEDLDFSLRMQKAGYRALYVPGSVVYHEVSHSFEGGDYTEKYARKKARNWFIFMKRHAPLHQKFAFYFLGVPFLVVRVIIREGTSGNLSALRGLARGMLDFINSRKSASD